MAIQLSEQPTLDELKAFFDNDRFATLNGCEIREGSIGHSVAELALDERHRNAHGNVMGGAVFTLADFALAIACNVGQEPTVSVSSTIEFMSTAKGTKLIATCNADKAGRRLAFYTTEVTDDTGRAVARITSTCARVG